MSRRTRPSATLRLVVLAALALLLGIAAFAPAVAAQTAVTGAADFRNAPQLTPGSYSDRIVTGDSAWYSIVYTNDTPYEFSADFDGAAQSDVELTVSLVAPTLTTIDGPDATVSGSGVRYPVGETNVWFLKVAVETSGQVGLDVPVVVTVDGVEPVGLEDCAATANCSLDDELAALTDQLTEARAQVGVIASQETGAAVQAQIEGFEGFRDAAEAVLPGAEARLNRAESTMADLCNPVSFCDPFPDPGTSTPLLGWVLGLAALGGGGYLGLKRLQANPAPAV